MDLTTLRTELQTDPLTLGYAPLVEAGAHNAIADMLNQKQYPTLGKVEITPMLIWIAKYQMMARLRTAAAGSEPTIASIAEVALLLVQNPNISAIDFGLPDVQTMLAALVQAGVVPEPAYQELLQTATTQVSRAQRLGLSHVSAEDISQALVTP